LVEAHPELDVASGGQDSPDHACYILALRILTTSIEKGQELLAINRALKAEKQRFEEELAKGVQQSGRLEGDGVLHRIREELLELGLKVREDLTLEQLEVEGLAYQVKGCWYSGWDYAREIYIPAKCRAMNTAREEDRGI